VAQTAATNPYAPPHHVQGTCTSDAGLHTPLMISFSKFKLPHECVAIAVICQTMQSPKPVHALAQKDSLYLTALRLWVSWPHNERHGPRSRWCAALLYGPIWLLWEFVSSIASMLSSSLILISRAVRTSAAI
jgi:hypothetical protein